MLAALRPKPFRGDQVAAGVVVLTVLVGLLAFRFDWPGGVHLTYTTVAAAFILAMAVLAPLEDERPRAYQTVLYVGGFTLALLALRALALVLGSDGLESTGTLAWVGAALTALGAFLAIGRNSPTGTLLASVSGAVAGLAAVEWAFEPGSQAFRWTLAALMAGFVLMALGHRDRRPDHAVQLVNAGGLATLGVALIDLLTLAGSLDGRLGSVGTTGWGWELLILAAGFGLVAYASVDRERGPAVLGVLNLVAFVALAAPAGDESLLGWPLVLALMAAFMLVIGLRPTTPAPPAPDAGDAPAPTVTLPPRGEPF